MSTPYRNREALRQYRNVHDLSAYRTPRTRQEAGIPGPVHRTHDPIFPALIAGAAIALLLAAAVAVGWWGVVLFMSFPELFQ